MVVSGAAGVALYQDAQALEQLSRTKESREKNAKEIAAINNKLSDSRFVDGYGSIGGEEFFSYLNIGDGLKRSGGKAWTDWNSKITEKILKLQNSDGTWAGHSVGEEARSREPERWVEPGIQHALCEVDDCRRRKRDDCDS